MTNSGKIQEHPAALLFPLIENGDYAALRDDKTTPSKILRKSEEIHYEAGTTKIRSIEMALRQTNLLRP